jgi:hydrogenase nickel incorporation protein HypA/HybF
MHELSLMVALREQVLAAAAARGARAVTAIHLRIGRLAGVEPEALQFAAALVLADSLAAGAALVIDSVEARCHCRPCAASFEVLDGMCVCPRCGAISRQLLCGRELALAALELEGLAPEPPRLASGSSV